MNSCDQNEHNGSFSTEYHSPLLPHPDNLGAHVGGTHPSFPTKSGSAVVNPLSADGQNQAVIPRTPYLSRRAIKRRKQMLKKYAARLALRDTLTNQMPSDDCPQELAVLPNLTITSTTSSVWIETYSSASKVVKQTSDVARAMANMPGAHSHQSTDNAQTPTVETQSPIACTGPALQDQSTLSMAIRRNDCLGMELNPGDIKKIQMGLHKMIDDHSNDNFSPNFEDYRVQSDALIVHCANEETVQWLRRVFDNNGKVFAGLRLVTASVLPKVRVAFTTKDILTSDPVVFLKRLQRQNSNLQTHHWMTEESPTKELDLQTKQLLHRWVFRIDQGSANAIKATNMTAYTGLSKGTFEFLPDVEPPKEIVIKQEAEQSSS